MPQLFEDPRRRSLGEFGIVDMAVQFSYLDAGVDIVFDCIEPGSVGINITENAALAIIVGNAFPGPKHYRRPISLRQPLGREPTDARVLRSRLRMSVV